MVEIELISRNNMPQILDENYLVEKWKHYIFDKGPGHFMLKFKFNGTCFDLLSGRGVLLRYSIHVCFIIVIFLVCSCNSLNV